MSLVNVVVGDQVRPCAPSACCAGQCGCKLLTTRISNPALLYCLFHSSCVWACQIDVCSRLDLGPGLARELCCGRYPYTDVTAAAILCGPFCRRCPPWLPRLCLADDFAAAVLQVRQQPVRLPQPGTHQGMVRAPGSSRGSTDCNTVRIALQWQLVWNPAHANNVV